MIEIEIVKASWILEEIPDTVIKISGSSPIFETKEKAKSFYKEQANLLAETLREVLPKATMENLSIAINQILAEAKANEDNETNQTP